MNALLLACQFLPLLGLLLILLLGTSERRIASLSHWFTHAVGSAILGLLITWGAQGFIPHEYLAATLFQKADYHFHLLFYLDRVGAVYLFCTWVIFAVIVRYCRYYLHREAGYKRFFLTIFAFAFGLTMVILSGSLDMLFAGWEIVGIASFLLIAFYRHRTQPIRNALRAYSIYRFCDLGLLLGALLSELLLHGNNHFSAFTEVFQEGGMVAPHPVAVFLLSLFLILAACGKSAQFPFCYWLPRAMEGPTPSSAIFYGALSVHLGVFLLLRTKPIWCYEYLSQFVVFGIGFLTVIVASLSERAQSNIKGQIAYASITQVGFMFMELAVGLESLVLMHFLGNAFLRCYQLLVSPSIVAHLLRVEGAADAGLDIRNSTMARSLPGMLRDSLPGVLENTLQVLALQEFNLETRVKEFMWDPLVKAGTVLAALPWQRHATIGVTLGVGAWLGVASGFPDPRSPAILAAVAMVAISLAAFAEKRSPYKVWNLVAGSNVLAGLVAWFAAGSHESDVGLYYSGIVPAWGLGIAVMTVMLRAEPIAESPYAYRAMGERKPRLTLLLFLSFLGMVSFPISAAFIGEDIVLYHASGYHPVLVLPLAGAFVLNGIAAAGLFQRLCMGRPVAIRHLDGVTEAGALGVAESLEASALPRP